MTDYEAVYESVMRYARTDASEVDSQTKLARYMRENDRLNRMSEKLVNKLVETRKAEEDIAAARAKTGKPSNEARKEAFAQNRANLDREQQLARSNGFRPRGTVTTHSGITHSVFHDVNDHPIYYDANTNRAREVIVQPDGSYKSTGRFAKTPKMFAPRT